MQPELKSQFAHREHIGFLRRNNVLVWRVMTSIDVCNQKIFINLASSLLVMWHYSDMNKNI